MARYIDADEFLKYIKANAPYMYTMVAIMTGVIPTADVEVVRRGYWKDLYDNKYDNHLYVCSECGGKALFEFYQNELDQTKERQVLSSGCSHCRAKMDGGNAE